MRPQYLLVMLGAAVFATGCASATGDRSVGAERRSLGNDCIFNFGIRDYTALDDRNVILYGPGRRAYHVVLTTPSINLRSEFTIGILDRDGDDRICPYGGDSILVDGPLRERIPIREIQALDEEGVDALLVEFGQVEAGDAAIEVTEIQ